MSLKDLDALLNTPVGRKVPRKKKKRRKGRASGVVGSGVIKDRSEAIMSQIERIQEDIDRWRLQSHPSITLIVVQKSTCTGCGSSNECTISPPMTGFRDRLGRIHYQPTFLPYKDLPIKIQRVTNTVPICHQCAHSAPNEGRTCRIGIDEQGIMDERQLSLPFRERNISTDLPKITTSVVSDNSLRKDLVPINQTPQGVSIIFTRRTP